MSLDLSKHNRTISLHCPTCAGTDFIGANAAEDSCEPLICANCKLSITPEDLRLANQENVQQHVEELKEAVVKDVQEELRRSLKKTFSGSKNITFK